MFCVSPHMDWVATVAVLAAVFVVRTMVVVIRTTVVVPRTTVVVARMTIVVFQTTDIAVVLRTTSVWAMDWVGLVLRSSRPRLWLRHSRLESFLSDIEQTDFSRQRCITLSLSFSLGQLAINL